MIRRNDLRSIFTLLLLGAAPLPALASDGRCVPVGGVAIADFFDEGAGRPIVISATMTGSVTSTAGKILARRETPTGLEMDMEHYFGTDDGGSFKTRDLAVLTAIPGKEGRYMIEVTYQIQPNVTRGTLEGVRGTLQSYGIVDLRDSDNLAGLVRYSGRICR